MVSNNSSHFVCCMLMLYTCSVDDALSSSGSSRPSYSPQPPSEASAPPPYSSPCGVPDRMLSPDDAINSLLNENLPKLDGKKNDEKIPFPGSGAATHGNTKLPRYSQIEVLSPTGNESVEILPAYPGNSSEFVQPPVPLQTVCLSGVCVCVPVCLCSVCVCVRACMCAHTCVHMLCIRVCIHCAYVHACVLCILWC